MKAVRFHAFGGAEVLRYEEVAQPTPGAGQVRIRVAATSFNRVDADIRAGSLQGPIPVRLPHTPGIDVAGTVDALGADVDEVSIGDQVVGFLPMASAGAAAEYVIAPAEALTGAPKHRSLTDLAALPLAGLTAWQALFDHGNLTARQRVLINGAGGAVGGYAVQLAKEARAQVIAVAGPGSVGRVKCAGADEALDHTHTDVTTAMTEPVYGPAPTGEPDPLGVDHITPLVTYLASPAAERINGQVFFAHGGMVAVLAPPRVAARFDASGAGWDDGELGKALGDHFADATPDDVFTGREISLLESLDHRDKKG